MVNFAGNLKSFVGFKFAHVVTLLSLISLYGCRSIIVPPDTKNQRTADERVDSALQFKTDSERHRISIQEMDQLTYNYADRYGMVIGSAVDKLKSAKLDPIQRRIAHQIKLDGVLAMNDIVSGNDPYAQTFDLLISVILESMMWIDENRAEEVFGENAPSLIHAMRMMRVEAWELAAKILNQDQLELLDYLILEWRRTHRDVDQVAYVKFDYFAGDRAAELLSDVKAGNGFLAPLSEASLVLKDWGRLTERAFWYSKRAPNVAAIQAEGAVNEILSAPEITSALETSERLGRVAESVPQTIDEQRRAIFADLDARQTELTQTLDDVRYVIADANSLASSATLLSSNIQQTLVTLGETIKIADATGRTFGLDKPPANTPARPFDINEYIVALTQLKEVLAGMKDLSVNADQLSRSDAWKLILKDMTDATDRRVDRVFSRICMAIGLAFILAIIYRLISIRLDRRRIAVHLTP